MPPAGDATRATAPPAGTAAAGASSSPPRDASAASAAFPGGNAQAAADPSGPRPGVEPSGTPPATEASGIGGLFAQLQSLWKALPGLVGDRVELFTLELQRASRALAQVVVLIVTVTVLGVTTWLLLWAAIVGLLVHFGLSPPVALLVAVLANAAVIAWAAARIRRLLPSIALPATRRHLMPSPSPRPTLPTVFPQPVVPTGAPDVVPRSAVRAET